MVKKPGGWRRQHRAAANRRGGGQRGSATMELAVAILSLTALLAPLIAGVQVVVTTARAQEVARAVARQVARGDDAERAAERAAQALPGATATVRRDGGDAVVTVEVQLRLPFRLSTSVSRTARTSLELP